MKYILHEPLVFDYNPDSFGALIKISPDKSYIYIGDNTHCKLYMLDVENPEEYIHPLSFLDIKRLQKTGTYSIKHDTVSGAGVKIKLTTPPLTSYLRPEITKPAFNSEHIYRASKFITALNPISARRKQLNYMFFADGIAMMSDGALLSVYQYDEIKSGDGSNLRAAVPIDLIRKIPRDSTVYFSKSTLTAQNDKAVFVARLGNTHYIDTVLNLFKHVTKLDSITGGTINLKNVKKLLYFENDEIKRISISRTSTNIDGSVAIEDLFDPKDDNSIFYINPSILYNVLKRIEGDLIDYSIVKNALIIEYDYYVNIIALMNEVAINNE